MPSADYSIVGQNYSNLRKPDQRIAALIDAELDCVETVVNIGAGTGSYEPKGKQVAAVEPSATMIAQRKYNKNTTIYRASAENLPFPSNAFDAALAILTIHHWSDWKKGLEEALRVAKSKVIIFTWIGMPNDFWLFNYFPEIEYIDKELFPTFEQFSSVLGDIEVTNVPIPANCTDGFLCAYWARPEFYLDARIRSAISTFSRIKNVNGGVLKLAEDLKSGKWKKRYGHILEHQEVDFGYRLVVSKI